jgi:hypothetical protein
MFVQDYILNGQGHGPLGEALQTCRWEPGLMRPFFNEHGQRAVTINTGYEIGQDGKKRAKYESRPIGEMIANGIISPVFNATTLRKEEWIELDRVVLRAARDRLRAWSDLARANSYGGFNAMGKMVLEHETASDPGLAVQDMDGIAEAQNDGQRFQLEGTPLPITHSGFWVSQRRLLMSRSSGMPIDTSMGEACGRRVAELVERTTIGTVTGLAYGGTGALSGGGAYSRTSQVHGYLTFPERLQYTSVTTPTGTNPQDTVDDILAMRDLLYAAKYYGPYIIYHSTDWDRYLDNDYVFSSGTGVAAPNKTLRTRLREIDGIQDVRRLDFLTAADDPFTLIMVQMTSDVARAIDGMPITTVQWESQGGARVDFRVMCIQVPQLRADFYGNTGILVGTTS